MLLILLAACRPEGQTEYVVDADEDGLSLQEDCDDGDASVGSATPWYSDADADGYGTTALEAACEAPEGAAAADGDCDDADAAIHPGAEDVCDEVDNDCDGTVDNGATSSVYYADADADGYGDENATVTGCAAPEGYVEAAGDCNDADADYNPGASETDCTDPNDYNCDGSVGYDDADADGFPACQECDDKSAATNPDATEMCDDIDNDCDGTVDGADAADVSTWYADLDEDAYGDAASTTGACDQPEGYVADATDCDDLVAAINPGAAEVCNDLDDNCDGLVDDDATDRATWYGDADGDGYGDADTTVARCDEPEGYAATGDDCNDADAAYNPGADESDCTDPNDYNCDGSVGYTDGDGDGFAACEECDDASAANHPDAAESCDEVDNDCDGEVDEADAIDTSTWYADDDGDTYGDASDSTAACDVPSGYVADATDCDDTASDVNPGQTELCNGTDDDCDGETDEDASADAATWYADTDGDGYGDAADSLESCGAPSGYVANSDDCDDGNGAVSPDADEICDGTDNDCDGATDDDSASDVSTWYADGDADGFGDAATTDVDCDQPAGFVADANDCDDSDADVSPDGSEVCNDVDDDCDGTADDGASDASTWYADSDGDTYGDAGATAVDCDAPAGFVADSSDCDDTDSGTHPGATESCNSVDDDCDGDTDTDASDELTWYADDDADGYGDAAASTSECEQPDGYVLNDNDCDDLRAATHPGADEYCNSIDDDCDSSVDESAIDASTWYGDGDGDGYGDAGTTASGCSAPADHVANDDDCDDTRSGVNPVATEACNGYDDDCDGAIDEAGATGESTFYLDADGDGYGSSSTTADCSAPSGYVSNDDDCADGAASINPGATEACDNIDNDCSDLVDDGGTCPCYVEYDADDDNYMFCASSKAWSTAESYCNTYGYEMASIQDSTENVWMVDTAYTYYSGKWWVGYNDVATEGTFVWSDGSAVTYTNWHSGEPNNSGNEDCTQLGRFGGYTWNDEPCSSAFYFVCEG